ncbi:MAG: hypothetical protein Q9177_001788 [Variospora cf. flavescens]
MDPLDSKTLVAEANVLGCVWGAGKSEDIDTEVQCYNHNVLGVGEVLAVVERRRVLNGVRGKAVQLADREPTAAVEEDDDWFRFAFGVFGPDVQGQAILASVCINGTPEGSGDFAELISCSWVFGDLGGIESFMTDDEATGGLYRSVVAGMV